MKEGAFLLMDCLGYKGIWKRTSNPESIIQQFITIRDKNLARSRQGFFKLFDDAGMEASISFLSDTVAIGVSPKSDNPPEDHYKGRLIIHASHLAYMIAVDFLNMTPPLAVRGVITYGNFSVSNQFIIGPAVDEAAELHELANAALIWLTPSCTDYYFAIRKESARLFSEKGADKAELYLILSAMVETFASPIEATTFKNKMLNASTEQMDKLAKIMGAVMSDPDNYWNFFPYPVPLKNGTNIKSLVVGPSFPNINFFSLRQMYLNAMSGDSIDIVIKRQNTIDFLDHSNTTQTRVSMKWANSFSELNNIFR